MLWRAIKGAVKGRVSKAIAMVAGTTWDNAQSIYDQEMWEQQFQEDLSRVFAKSPSVIKTKYYELYCSSNGNVYAYMLGSGERDIYFR